MPFLHLSSMILLICYHFIICPTLFTPSISLPHTKPDGGTTHTHTSSPSVCAAARVFGRENGGEREREREWVSLLIPLSPTSLPLHSSPHAVVHQKASRHHAVHQGDHPPSMTPTSDAASRESHSVKPSVLVPFCDAFCFTMTETDGENPLNSPCVPEINCVD